MGADVVNSTENFNTIVISDASEADINFVIGTTSATITVAGRLSTLTISNFVGNEDNYRIVDQNGNTVNIGTSGTTTAGAPRVPTDILISGNAGAAGTEDDFYAFTAPTDGTMTASVSGATPGMVVQFYTSAGGPRASATVGSDGRATATFVVTRSEDYFVSVGGSAGSAYNLDLVFSAQNTTDTLLSPVNVAAPLVLDNVVFDASNTADFYRVVAPDDMTLVVNTANLTGNVDIHLYDSNRNLIKSSTLSGTAADALSFDAEAGDVFFVEIVSQDTTAQADIQITWEDRDDTGPNSSIDTAEKINLPASFSGRAGLSPNFGDYYEFTLDSAGQITLNLTNLQDDLRIDLFNSDGVRIGQAQTTGTADESLIQTLAAGTYFIGIVGQTPVDASPYDFSASFTIPDAADTLTDARSLGGLPLDVTQSVGEGSDSADYYAHTPANDGTITVTISDLSGPIGVEGFDPNGIRIGSNVLGNADDKTISFAVTGGQTHYFGAIPIGDGGGGTYTLEAEYNRDGGNALSTPLNVDPNFSRTEAIGFGSDTEDNFRVISSSEGTLTVNLTNLSAPVDLFLYDTEGNRLASSQGSGGADEQITFELQANVAYIIGVVPTSSAAQGFYDIESSFTVSSSSSQSAAAPAVVDENGLGS